MIKREIKVPYAAPIIPNIGNQIFQNKNNLKNIYNIGNQCYIGYFVSDRPSKSFKAWKAINGINETAIISKYGIARNTTSSGWFILNIKGF